MATFVKAPAVVGSALHQMNHLPPILPDISCPQMSSLAVEGDSPRVADAVDPNFGTRSLKVEERVIARNRIGAPRLWMIDINTHDSRGQVAEVLPLWISIVTPGEAGKVGIGVHRTVAGGDVEVAVGTEREIAAVMVV